MDRLQLATLVSWADHEGLQGRKRLQKVVFFLQEAGCPLDCRFTLHHFGPYSREVADRCDEMVVAELINERVSHPGQTTRLYSYTLDPATRDQLARSSDPRMKPFEALGKELINEPDIWLLELGSTILLYHRQGHDWPDALQRACEFKKVSADDPSSQNALALARRVLETAAN